MIDNPFDQPRSPVNPLFEENKSTVTASFNIKYLKDGSHIVYLPIPDDLLRLIGLVAAHWGTFEVELNKLIAALLSAISRVEPGWERFGFKRRKTLFAELVKENLAITFPIAAANYKAIAGNAADLYWRRNLAVHGLYRVTFPGAGPNSPTFWAGGVHNNKSVEIPIDTNTLEKLWHDIAHLGGELRTTANLHGTASGWPWTLPDKQILQVYLESHHPWNPNPHKRTTLPESSQG
jgi:hypothetical protein